MKKNKIILPLLIGASVFSLGMKNMSLTPHTAYRVYLYGKSIGLIKSKSSLEKYIDKMQSSLKAKYNVNKVYAPEGLKIEKEITYDDNITSTTKIYDKIKNSTSFTLDGYKITIRPYGDDKKKKSKIIYVLDKNVFKDGIDTTVKSFVSKADYNTYSKNKKQTIKDVGKIVENIYIGNKITIKKAKIPADKKIYTDEDSLSKFLLFGNNNDNNISKYVTKEGDTIEDVAFNNKMSTDEFLIINPNFTSSSALLYPGQEVNIGVLKPEISIVEQDKVVAYQEKNFTTKTEEDGSKLTNYSEVKQKGVKGKDKVTQNVTKVNGETINIETTSEEEITPAIEEIVVKGTKSALQYGNVTSGYGAVVATKGEWGWPATCNTISSPFGYRWGTLHDGTDIAGCGFGSNIFAAQAGTVVTVKSHPVNGKYIVINHNNGYYSLYAHLSGFNVREGQNVSKGEVIGFMGRTGAATGVHLHFAIWHGYPYRGGKALNAMSFY